MLALLGLCCATLPARAELPSTARTPSKSPPSSPARASASPAAEPAPRPLPSDKRAPSSATPEPSKAELTRARTTFQRGVGFAARGDYTSAAKRFREALAIHPAPAITYNLASALYELKQYDEAYDLVQSVLTDEATPEEVRQRARRLEPSLHSHIARLTVVLSGQSDNVTVRVDGEPLSPALVGTVRKVSPGPHTVVAERDGLRLSEREVQVAAGTAALVELNLAIAPREVADSSVEQHDMLARKNAADESEREARRKKRRTWIIVGASVVVVGAAGGLTYGLTR